MTFHVHKPVHNSKSGLSLACGAPMYVDTALSEMWTYVTCKDCLEVLATESKAQLEREAFPLRRVTTGQSSECSVRYIVLEFTDEAAFEDEKHPADTFLEQYDEGGMNNHSSAAVRLRSMVGAYDAYEVLLEQRWRKV